MLPGISAEDCLFADLAADLPVTGWQSFEATDFLAMRRRFDPSSTLILWQVGLLGEASVRKGLSCPPERLHVLARYLRTLYPARQPAVLYEAAQFPICDPLVRWTTIGELPREKISPAMTLCVMPKTSRIKNSIVLGWCRETDRKRTSG
jgi:hypothetical protein